MRTVTVLILAIFVIALTTGCGSSLPMLPASHDILGIAVESSGLSCRGFSFTTSSAGGGEIHRHGLGDYGEYVEWSPDGNWILSIQDEYQTLRIANATSRRFAGESVLSSTKILDASWGPDSSTIVFTTLSEEIKLVDASCVQAGLTCQPEVIEFHPGRDPDWSPDGTRMAFSWDGDNTLNGTADNDIYLLDLDGRSAPLNLTQSLENCRDPDWSPDGNRLAFTCQWDVFVSTKDGDKTENLTGGLFEGPNDSSPWWPVDEDPKWTPDGGLISFISPMTSSVTAISHCEDEVSNFIHTIDPESGEIKQITNEEGLGIRWHTWAISAE